MPFPISVDVGDGSVAAVAVSGATIALVFLLKPIISKFEKTEDLRFAAGCVVAGVLAVLVAGIVCTHLYATRQGDDQDVSRQPVDARPDVPRADPTRAEAGVVAQVSKQQDCSVVADEESSVPLDAPMHGSQRKVKGCVKEEAKEP